MKNDPVSDFELDLGESTNTTLGTALSQAMDNAQFIQALLTRTLENNLVALESLRSGIERAQRKDIEDVRDFGDTVAAALFAGVESNIDYEDLLDLIDEYKLGLAKRQLADLAAIF